MTISEKSIGVGQPIVPDEANLVAFCTLEMVIIKHLVHLQPTAEVSVEVKVESARSKQPSVQFASASIAIAKTEGT